MFYTFFWSIMTGLVAWAGIAYAVAAIRYRSRALAFRSACTAVMATSFVMRLWFDLGSLGHTDDSRTVEDIISVLLFCLAILADVLTTARADYKAVLASHALSARKLMLFR